MWRSATRPFLAIPLLPMTTALVQAPSSPQALADQVSQEIGVSEWVTISQAQRLRRADRAWFFVVVVADRAEPEGVADLRGRHRHQLRLRQGPFPDAGAGGRAGARPIRAERVHAAQRA
ncbi:hypothetical protein G6F57_022748 [Rhizopus arrhizus]|nr:hypothetical protein G6F57_022748 [Rhizopus arrhizus]